jgi:hypothetical protein
MNITEQYRPEATTVRLLSRESIKLFNKFDYELINQLRIKEEHLIKINLCKRFDPENAYPRFHMILTLPFRNPKIQIATFHMDEQEDKASNTFLIQNIEKKNQEIKRLIDIFGKEEEGIARDELLLELKSDLLFGNIREKNHGRRNYLVGKKSITTIGKKDPEKIKDNRRVKINKRKKYFELLDEKNIPSDITDF